MTHPIKPLVFATALTTALFALAPATSIAAGTHAGGHAHGDMAIGEPGQAAQATRTIKITMTDAMRFTPSAIQARQGETIRFVITNAGQLKHEMVLGTQQDLKTHHEAMKKHPDMQHAEPNMVTLGAGQSGEVVWRFTRAGKVDFACLQTGHYEAGMKGLVRVSTAAR